MRFRQYRWNDIRMKKISIMSIVRAERLNSNFESNDAIVKLIWWIVTQSSIRWKESISSIDWKPKNDLKKRTIFAVGSPSFSLSVMVLICTSRSSIWLERVGRPKLKTTHKSRLYYLDGFSSFARKWNCESSRLVGRVRAGRTDCVRTDSTYRRSLPKPDPKRILSYPFRDRTHTFWQTAVFRTYGGRDLNKEESLFNRAKR